jgi:hypothetical protein
MCEPPAQLDFMQIMIITPQGLAMLASVGVREVLIHLPRSLQIGRPGPHALGSLCATQHILIANDLKFARRIKELTEQIEGQFPKLIAHR